MFQTGRSLKTEMKSVDQKFREIDKLFDKFSEKNHEQLSNAEIKQYMKNIRTLKMVYAHL